MRPLDIKTKIALAGTSQAAIAAYLKVRSASIGRVIRGEMRSQRIEAELSKIVGQPVFDAPCGKPGRPKTTWTGQLAAPAWDGVDRRKKPRLESECRAPQASAGARK